MRGRLGWENTTEWWIKYCATNQLYKLLVSQNLGKKVAPRAFIVWERLAGTARGQGIAFGSSAA